MQYSRKSFLQTLGAGAGSLLAGPSVIGSPRSPRDTKSELTLGLASYTLRGYGLDDALLMAGRLGLKQLCLKSMHLPLESSEEEIKAVVKKVKAAGLELYGGGVIYMETEAEVENAFRYAHSAQLKVIVGVPNHDLLKLVEKKVKETDIKLAIHNHGPGDDLYPTPESVYDKVKAFDSRLGLCIDIGHVIRLGLDPAENIKKYADRLYDLHMKDVDAASSEGESIEIGRGVINIPEVIKALQAVDYSGVMAIEFEKDEKDALPGLSESVGYVRGVMKMMPG